MSKILNELYTSRWYLSKQIEELEKGGQFVKDADSTLELKDNLENLTKIISSYTPSSDKEKIDLWYEKAIIPSFSQDTKGKYSNNYPKGIVVHLIEAPQVGGKEKAEFWAKWGKGQGYTFFTMGNEGSVIQSFPLDEWGKHAGKSFWTGLGEDVSTQLVGIEIVCEGRVEKFDDGSFGQQSKIKIKNPDGSYKKKPDGSYKYKKKPDGSYKYKKRYVNENDLRHISSNKENIREGYYQKCTENQEEALIKLILWLKQNNPDVFDLNLVLGHDEVAGPSGLGLVNNKFKNSWRKNDPGGSLSTSMPEFRRMLIERYKNI